MSGCDFAYYGKDRCPILGPDKEVLANGEESDKGRIYTTWLDSWEGPQELNLKMDGQTHGVNYTGLTDSAGRVVPDGYTLYVNDPSYGKCWPQASILDFITFDDSWTTESWHGTFYEIDILPKDPECTK